MTNKEVDVMELEKKQVESTATPTEQEQERVSYIQKRFQAMEKWRSTEDLKRDKRKKAYKAKVPASKTGKAEVNIPLEQVLVETYIWMQEKLQFQVKGASGKVDYDYQYIYEMVFDHFYDREAVAREIRKYRRRKAILGTGVLLSSPTFEKKSIYQGWKGKFFEKGGKTETKTLWHFGIKAIDPELAYFDEWANCYEECMDAILIEDLRREEFVVMYWEDKDFSNTNQVGKFRAATETNGKEHETDIVRLWHYWNKIDGSYSIIANKSILVYDGVYTCKHGLLPLIPVQHYERVDSLYGDGIPARLESVRPYVNSLLKVTLDSAWLNASPGLMTGDGVEVDGEIYLTAGALEEIKMIWQSQGVGTFQTNINVGQLVDVLKLMEDFGMVTTGINYKAPYTSPAKTAFEAGLMKEEQNTRARPVIEVDYEWLDTALTIMLVNIIDFVPYATSEEIVDGEPGDLDRYKIEVKDKKVEFRTTEEKGKDGKMIKKTTAQVKDDPGAVEELQLKPDLFVHGVGLKLQIVTPYTTSIMKSIQKAEFQEYTAQFVQLMQIWAPQEMMDKLNEMYGMSPDDMTYKTKSDARKAQFAEAQEIAAQVMLATNPTALPPLPNNEDSQQPGVQQTPTVQ